MAYCDLLIAIRCSIYVKELQAVLKSLLSKADEEEFNTSS